MTRLLFAVVFSTLFSTFQPAASAAVDSLQSAVSGRQSAVSRSPIPHPSSLIPHPSQEGGCVQGDCYNGYGVWEYPSGNRYVGDFLEGKPHGRGILYFANGNKYLGNWSKNYRDGEGKFIFSEGHEYQGQFRLNAFHGKGVMRFANGDRYEGDWLRNQPNGFGKYAFHSGGRYEGNFQNGKRHGDGTMFYADGSKFSGGWRENRKHGRGTFYDTYGKSSSVEYANGKSLGGSADPNREEEEEPTSLPGTGDEPGSPILVGSGNSDSPDSRGDIPTSGNEASSIRIWAVVVGVAAYTHMPTLRYTDDDAYQFYAFLKSPEGGALPDEQVKVLVDDDATRDNILDKMRSVLLQADENDVVLFYFSGHGIEGAFIPTDFDGINYRLYHEEIRRILEQSKAKCKIVLGDACHSGSLYGGQEPLAAREVQTMLDRYYKAFENCGGGMALLMSSKGKEVSLEDIGLRSGVFSHYLVRGLKGEADFNGDKIVTISELSEYVHDKVASYTAGAQTPVLTGKFDRNMPMSVVRK